MCFPPPNPNGHKFQREDRYVILKRKDLAFLNKAQTMQLDRITAKIRRFRGPELQCVVVESDWPEFEPTWDAIQRRMEGRPTREAELQTEVDRLNRLTASLTNGEGLVCMDCDGTGWLENRVDGRYPCTCMTEAEPYQILIDLLERIGRIANGEDQVADDDTEGMAHIAKIVAEAVRP